MSSGTGPGEPVRVTVSTGSDAEPPVVVDIVVRDPAATVDDLAALFGLAPDRRLHVDGLAVPAGTTIEAAGILRGSSLSARPGGADPHPPDDIPYLSVIAGLDSGRWFPISVGQMMVGRNPANAVAVPRDLSASLDQCRIDVAPDRTLVVTDLEAINKTFVDDRPVTVPTLLQPGSTLLVGSTMLQIASGDPQDNLAPTAHRRSVPRFRRPPRRAPPVAPPPLRYPNVAPPQAHKPTLSIAVFITPLLFAAAMVVILGSLRFALFGLLAPVGAGVAYFEGRRRHRKALLGGDRATQQAVAQLRVDLELQRRQLEQRLADTAPDLVTLQRRATLPTRRLWERRSGHSDFLEVRLASGLVPFEPVVEAPARVPVESAEIAIREAGTFGVGVAALSLAGHWTGVYGDRQAALAVARSLICQVATTSGPTDVVLAIDVDPDRAADWNWARWLPHTVAPDGSSLVRPAAAVTDLLATVSRFLERPGPGRRAPDGPAVVLVVDRLGGPSPRLVATPGVASAVVVGATVDELSHRCDAMLEVGHLGDTTLLDVARGHPVSTLLAAGIAPEIADLWARRLARLEDADNPTASLPALVDGADLWIGVPPRLPEERRSRLAWRLGVGVDGVVEVDLVADGPHVVIAGVPGSGRTEALRSLVASLAAAHDPEEVTVAVLDLAGGGLAKLRALPQLAGYLDDVGSPRSAGGPQASLEAEVLRRSSLLRAAGSDDLAGYVASGAGALSHLVIVVDDPGTVAPDRATALEALLQLAASAGHLGIHVVLATTQPGGRAAAALLACAGTRLALRLSDAAARAFVGIDDPAAISRTQPGRGWLRLGDLPAFAVQVGWSGAQDPFRDRPLAQRPVGTGVPGAAKPAAGPAGPTALAEVIEAVLERRLAPAAALWGAPADGLDGDAPPSLPTMLGLASVEDFDPATAWLPPPQERFLRVPIGGDGRGQIVELDLKEAAFDGMGPHGLVVGATGSGKSELLRTLVTALVATHGPDELSLVVVDFKGGATFAGLADLPHIAGEITNLESDLSGVDRMEAALLGEQQRRQQLLRDAGHLDSAHDYRLKRSSQPDLPPLPELLVIVDEFAELLESRPEFIDMFLSIGRLGRSLGVHLLLATQRLEEGRLRGLESHLRYRVSLRTNSAAESRAVLGVPDAASLPSEPGIGYVRVDSNVLRRFRASMVSTPRGEPGAPPPPPGDMARLVARMQKAAPQTHQVWLPVLPPQVALGPLRGPIEVHPRRGLQASEWPGLGGQRVPLGVIDRPREQARTLLIGDFAGATGNVAVVGSPRSGKSTFLRTLVAALALTHTPDEAQVYAIDFGGGQLGDLIGLPHVGTVAHQSDIELVHRVLNEMSEMVKRRERLFKDRSIDSPATFRRMRAGGDLPEEPGGDIYLLIDGWPALRATSDLIEERLTDIATRGLGFGVHVILTANRWLELRPALRDALAGRLELRLTEPFDSAVERKAAANVPVGAPGRGLTERAHHFLTALPVLDLNDDAPLLATGVVDVRSASLDLIARSAAAWTGASTPAVRTLPHGVRAADLRAPARSGASGRPSELLFGVAEPDLRPVGLSPESTDQHVLVLGDGLSGKTTFLHTFLQALVRERTPDQARILLVDPRRKLLDVVPEAHQWAYVGSGPAAAAEIIRLRDALEQRLPTGGLTAKQLRERSWWEGPEAYVVVDDQDLLVSQTSNPLLPLVDILAQAGDVGVHLVIARRVAGWARSQFEPVVQRLREVGTTGLVLSGEPAEGPIFGSLRASPRPPGRGSFVRYRQPPVLVQVAQPNAAAADDDHGEGRIPNPESA